MRTFGEKLRYLRREKGWTQEILAKNTGFSVKSIYNWENNKRRPTDYYYVATKLSDVFKVDLMVWFPTVAQDGKASS